MIDSPSLLCFVPLWRFGAFRLVCVQKKTELHSSTK